MKDSFFLVTKILSIVELLIWRETQVFKLGSTFKYSFRCWTSFIIMECNFPTTDQFHILPIQRRNTYFSRMSRFTFFHEWPSYFSINNGLIRKLYIRVTTVLCYHSCYCNFCVSVKIMQSKGMIWCSKNIVASLSFWRMRLMLWNNFKDRIFPLTAYTSFNLWPL